jgi:hypothetical protein
MVRDGTPWVGDILFLLPTGEGSRHRLRKVDGAYSGGDFQPKKNIPDLKKDERKKVVPAEPKKEEPYTDRIDYDKRIHAHTLYPWCESVSCCAKFERQANALPD